MKTSIHVQNKKSGNNSYYIATIYPNGTIWIAKNRPLLLSFDDDETVQKLREIVESNRLDDIPAENFARIMDTDHYLIETQADQTRREELERAKRPIESFFTLSKAGKPCIVVDLEKIPASPDTITHKGVEFQVTGLGEAYQIQHRKVKRAYLHEEHFTVTDKTADNLRFWRNLLSGEHDRYQYQFNRMMDDENNDGVRPPRSPSTFIDKILKAMTTLEAEILIRIQNQAQETPAIQTGWIRSTYAKRALTAYASGSSIEAAEQIANSYKDDPAYIEAILSM